MIRSATSTRLRSSIKSAVTEAAIIFLDLPAEQVDPVLRAFQPLGGAHDTNEIPHEIANFTPALCDHNFFVAVGHAAFIPWADGGRRRQTVPMRQNMIGAGIAKYETFKQAVRRQPVGAMQPRFA